MTAATGGGSLAGTPAGSRGVSVLLRESSAPLVRQEQRTDATNEADDADDPEHGATPEAQAHDKEDEPCDEEAEANEVDWHSSLTLGRTAGRSVPQLGDWTDVPATLSLSSQRIFELTHPATVRTLGE